MFSSFSHLRIYLLSTHKIIGISTTYNTVACASPHQLIIHVQKICTSGFSQYQHVPRCVLHIGINMSIHMYL